MKKHVMAAAAIMTLFLATGCGGAPQQSQASYIGVDAAKSIALEHAGLQASQVSFIKSELDEKNDVYYYEIDFTAGGAELDYDIDAITGVIIEHNNPSPAGGIAVAPQTDQPAASQGVQGQNQPADGGQTPSPAGGQSQTPVQGQQAANGYGQGQANAGSGDIGSDKAMAIALEKVPGATTADIYGFEREIDDGRLKYEGTIVYNLMEYDFEIDGHSGALIEWDSESVYD